MVKLNKKTIEEIRGVSVMGEVLRSRDPNSETHGHWTDLPPENWTTEETELFDTLSELEYRIKQQIYKTLGIAE